MKSVLLLIFTFSATLAEYKSYEGYTVYEVTPQTPEDSVFLKELYNSEKFDFWSTSNAVHHPVSIMVSADLKETFISLMDINKLNYKVLIQDVERVNEAERQRQARTKKVAHGRINFEEYHRYNVILDYIDELAEQYPDIVTLEEYGRSYEDRPLKLLRVGCESSKPTIFIEGGIHAREWIAPAMVLYTAQQLIENQENRELIENACWILIVVTNPDGYEYSHTDERMWRKTRSTGIICNGADGNRNFDFQWGGPGTSTSECSEIFIGGYPFSEPEVFALAEVGIAEEQIDLYLAIHSYGQYILYPWGHTQDPADNVEDLHEAALQAAEAIEAVSGTKYTTGSSANVLYFASGSSKDWFKGVAKVPLSYTIELPGGGDQGFDLPADRIQPVITETWSGIVAFYNYVIANYRK